MSYHLKTLAPCTVFVSGKSYRVEAGDPLHLTKSDADQILSSQNRTKFAVISIDEENEPPLVSEQEQIQALDLSKQSDLVPSSEAELYSPKIDDSQDLGLHAPGTSVDPLEEVYSSYKEESDALINQVSTPAEPEAPKASRSRAKAKSVEKETPTEE
jgi:hypothetical protein